MDVNENTNDTVTERILELVTNSLDDSSIMELSSLLSIVLEKDEVALDVDCHLLKELVAISGSGEALLRYLKQCVICRYNAKVFHNKLKEKFECQDTDDNNKITIALLNVARKFVKVSPMLNLLYQDPQPKAAVKRSFERTKLAEKILTQKEVAKKHKSQDHIDVVVDMIYQILQKIYKMSKEPIDYYRFVVDTSSFTNTVENIFYTSFLCKKKRAKLIVTENVLQIVPFSENDLASDCSNEKLIVSYTMNDWQKVKFKCGYIQKHKSL